MTVEYRIVSSGRSRHAVAAAFVAACLLLSGPVRSEDVTIFKTAPSVDELQKALGGGDASAPKKMRTRSIVFGSEGAAPAQSPPPAQAAPEPEPQAPASYNHESAPAPKPKKPKPAPAAHAAAPPPAAIAPVAAPVAVPAAIAATAPAQTVNVSEKAVGFPINFDVGSANIRSDSIAFLDAIAGLLQRESQMRMLIEGHTDASGNFLKNLELSKSRAVSVQQYLIIRYGLDPSRLSAIGKGPTEPLPATDPNSPANRRVQFRVMS